MAVPQGRNGYVSFAGTVYPVYSWAMPNPRNLQAPDTVGNGWNTNYAEGLKTTRFVANLNLRAKATEYLALAWWNYFQSRAWASGFDDTTAITIIASSGRKTYTLGSCKAEAFTLIGKTGMQLGLQVVFVAPGVPTHATDTPIAYNNFDNSPPLMWSDVTLGGITGNCYGWQIAFANNHQPNGVHNGTKNLASWDAGIPKVSASFTFDERTVEAPPFAAAGTVTASLVGAATRLFTLKNVIPNDDLDGSGDVGQVYRQYNCLVEGTTTVAPLVVT